MNMPPYRSGWKRIQMWGPSLGMVRHSVRIRNGAVVTPLVIEPLRHREEPRASTVEGRVLGDRADLIQEHNDRCERMMEVVRLLVGHFQRHPFFTWHRTLPES